MRPAYSECRHESSQRTGKTLRHPLHRNLGQNANGSGWRFLYPCQRNTQGQSSKTPSWIGTSNRQYLLPKHEMLYSNVSPKTKNFRENNRIKMFPRFLKTNKNLALYTLCPKFFHLYFVMYILYRVILFTI